MKEIVNSYILNLLCSSPPPLNYVPLSISKLCFSFLDTWDVFGCGSGRDEIGRSHTLECLVGSQG
jgi:hypothetical protein